MCKEKERNKDGRMLGQFRQVLATTCLGAISLGASLAWTSPVLPKLEDRNSTTSFHITNEEGSWIGAMLAIGTLSAAIPAGYLADRYGPKKCTIGFVIPVVIFTVLVIFANDVYTLCIARLFSGIATGGVSVVAPMYISEISDVSLRGILGSFFELLIYLGVVLTAVCGAYVNYITLTVILGVLALALGVIFLFLPESPTYLVKTNRRGNAEDALRFYRSQDFSATEVIEEIDKSLRGRSQHKTNFRKLLGSKSVVRGLIACVGLTSFQQLTAINGVTFYTVQIFQAAGTDLGDYTSAIIVAVFQLLSAAGFVIIVEKATRKTFLYISSLGTCVCLLLLGLYFHLKEYQIYFKGMDALPLASLIFFSITFAVGLGPIPWMINGELFSPEIKGVANGITITTNWAFLFVITKTFPVMLKDIGPYLTFYVYSVFMVLCVVFVRFFVPETKGKTLEQIQSELSV